jgi:hypothetical protein
MITLYIRYTLDPNKLQDFEIYAKALATPIERCGGVPAGYYLPTKIAGPMNSAIGLIEFPSLAAYEKYREKLGADPEATEVTRRVWDSGCILNENRSIVSLVPETRR